MAIRSFVAGGRGAERAARMPPAARGGKFAAAFVAVWLLLVGFGLGACAPVRTDGAPPEALAGVDAAFRDWMERHGVGEASLAIGWRGRLVAALGYGGRDAGERALLASLSKAITAVCVG